MPITNSQSHFPNLRNVLWSYWILQITLISNQNCLFLELNRLFLQRIKNICSQCFALTVSNLMLYYAIWFLHISVCVFIQLNENIQSILAVLEAQNSKIESLQYQLVEQQEFHRQQIESDVVPQQPQNIEEHLGKLEGIVTSRVERMFTQHTQKESILVMDLYTVELLEFMIA